MIINQRQKTEACSQQIKIVQQTYQTVFYNMGMLLLSFSCLLFVSVNLCILNSTQRKLIRKDRILRMLM